MKLLKTLSHEVPEHVNGGESIIIWTQFYSKEDDGIAGIYLNQLITMHSYGNSATFSLCGNTLKPDFLRKLATDIEVEIAKLASK